MFFVYILVCNDESLYVGHTKDVLARVDAHNNGRGAAFTYQRRPLRLVYTEPHETEAAAIRRERQIKGWTRAKKQALISGEPKRLKQLSQRRTRFL